jgi:hypothetical protein
VQRVRSSIYDISKKMTERTKSPEIQNYIIRVKMKIVDFELINFNYNNIIEIKTQSLK